MSLSNDQVKRVATLARLELEDDEVEQFAGQLSKVLDYIEQLNELDTDGVEPTSHALDLANVFRDDRVNRPFDADVWGANAPSKDQGHFRVPKVIEGE